MGPNRTTSTLACLKLRPAALSRDIPNSSQTFALRAQSPQRSHVMNTLQGIPGAILSHGSRCSGPISRKVEQRRRLEPS